MIERPTILITGLGRTGTEFFSDLFGQIVPDSTSLHEPDVVPTFPTADRGQGAQLISQLLQLRFWRVVIRRGFGAWTLRELSDSRFIGKLGPDEAARNLNAQRAAFVAAQPGSVYVEAHHGYRGLLDITPGVFRNHRAIFVVRDGRSWVRSVISFGNLYGPRTLRHLFAHRWPTAAQIPGDAYATEWNHLSQFERCCWAWSRLNEYALSTMRENPNARLFFFEKVFSGENRYQYLDGLIRFATDRRGIDPARIGKAEGWLDRKINARPIAISRGNEWTADQNRQFAQICGHLMEKLGYDY